MISIFSVLFTSLISLAGMNSQGVIHGVVKSFNDKEVVIMNRGQKVSVPRSRIDPGLKLKAGMSIDVKVDIK